MNGKIVALAAVGIMLAGQASAAAAATAQISSVSGSVVASSNGRFSPATTSTTLTAGDRVVARDGAAQVKFSDGCVISLKPQAMLTVGQSSPCATGAGLVSASDSNAAQFGDDTTGFKKASVTFAVLAALLLIEANSRNNDSVSH